jgi:hypothetical protein
MSTSPVLAILRRQLDMLRAEYVSSGRGEEFDTYVRRLRAEDRWPFDRSD